MQVLLLAASLFLAPAAPKAEAIDLPVPDSPSEHHGEAFELASTRKDVLVWRRGREPARTYFDEFLPALFERTLLLDEAQLEGGALEWIFTGDHGGFTITIEDSRIQLFQRFYDSFGFSRLGGEKVRASRHPEKRWLEGKRMHPPATFWRRIPGHGSRGSVSRKQGACGPRPG